jgi:hypothetical protein
MNENYNILEDFFSENFVDLSTQFHKSLNEANKVPLIVFDGENNYENSIVLGSANVDYLSIKSIYEQLDHYPLKRAPFFYMSQADIYWPSTGGSIDTYIIFTQDGFICNHWAKHNEPVLVRWDAFSGLKKTHDSEVNFDCIHLLQGSAGMEIYINATTGSVKSGSHDEAQLLTNFGYSSLETMWTYIEKNRNASHDSFPMELWYWILKFEDIKID